MRMKGIYKPSSSMYRIGFNNVTNCLSRVASFTDLAELTVHCPTGGNNSRGDSVASCGEEVGDTRGVENGLRDQKLL